MVHAVSPAAAASNLVNRNDSACAQKAEDVDWFPRLFVLYAVTSLTGTTLKIVQKLGIDKLLQSLTPTLRAALARLVCVTSLGRREAGRSVFVDDTYQKRAYVFYSAVNVTESTFAPVEYRPADFPFDNDESGALTGFHHRRAHFMSLCAKAAYEDMLMFRDIASRNWKLQPFEYLGMLETEDKDHGGPLERQHQIAAHLSCNRKLAATKAQAIDSFIPQTRAHIIANDHAVILAFRGTEPANLVQWATDATVELSGQKEVKGKVHEGFHAALFHRHQNSDGSYSSVALFQSSCEALAKAVGKNKSLYVTGHSLGGALVSVFAHCLAKLALDEHIPGWAEGPEIVKLLMARVTAGGGIYTFAGPLVGDDEFRTFSQTHFRDNIFRIVHAGDWVPQVPPYNLGYRHHTREFFLTSFGDLYNDPDDIEHWRRLEHASLSFLALYIYKLVMGVSCRHESPVRTLERLLFLFIAPGLTDHWPSDYEFCLRKLCLNRQRAAAQAMVEPKEAKEAIGCASLDNHHPPMPTRELDFQAEVPAAQKNGLEQA